MLESVTWGRHIGVAHVREGWSQNPQQSHVGSRPLLFCGQWFSYSIPLRLERRIFLFLNSPNPSLGGRDKGYTMHRNLDQSVPPRFFLVFTKISNRCELVRTNFRERTRKISKNPGIVNYNPTEI